MGYIKGSLKVLTNYGISLLLFSFFILSFYNYRVFYAFLIFLLMLYLIYTDIKRLAQKEKRPQYNLNPYPWKGLIYGLIGFSPLILLTAVSPLIIFNSEVANNLKRVTLNLLLGPLYGFIKLGGGTYTVYMVSVMIIPVVSMLSYMSGYYDFNLKSVRKNPTPNKR